MWKKARGFRQVLLKPVLMKREMSVNMQPQLNIYEGMCVHTVYVSVISTFFFHKTLFINLLQVVNESGSCPYNVVFACILWAANFSSVLLNIRPFYFGF